MKKIKEVGNVFGIVLSPISNRKYWGKVKNNKSMPMQRKIKKLLSSVKAIYFII